MDRFADDNNEELSAESIAARKTAADDAQAALKAAQTIVELEGRIRLALAGPWWRQPATSCSPPVP